MRFEDMDASIEVTVHARELHRDQETSGALALDPCHRVEVRLERTGVFTVRDDDVYVLADDLERFVSDLERLDRDRRGEAVLRETACEELTLTLRSTDNAGHMAAEVRLIERAYGFREYEYDVSLTVVIDPSQLMAVLRELAALKA